MQFAIFALLAYMAFGFWGMIFTIVGFAAFIVLIAAKSAAELESKQ